MSLFRYYRNIVPQISSLGVKHFHTSSNLSIFYERNEKAGYRDNRKLPSKFQLAKEGFKQLKKEIELWQSEMKERLMDDPILIFRAGETDVFWDFKKEDCLKDWIVTSDNDNSEGFSSCSFIVNKNGNGLFSGELNTRIPKTGHTKRAGYCNIKTARKRKSFQREDFINWCAYNTLVLKVRGDGRSYMVNLHTKGYFDITWNDLYSYVLYTRGGPYWQITKIPFSKFFFSAKGRIQDRQFPLPSHKITNFSITAADKIDGPFSLEIQYVGVEFDPNHTEEFAYEMYETERNIPAN